jgi:hypothetical protein
MRNACVWETAAVAKQRQQKLQYRLGSLGAIQELEPKSDEQLLRETRQRAAARAILGARAAERYDVKAARSFFNEAMVACHPQERPALRQMMKASMALAERRPDELKQAVEKLGQQAPSGRQLFMLRLMGLVAPAPGVPLLVRVRGIALLILIVLLLLAVGFGLAMLVALPFGGVGTGGAAILGLLIVIAVLGVLTLLGRRRQAKAAETRAAGPPAPS